MPTKAPPAIFEAVKALDRLADVFDAGFDTLAEKVEALPMAEHRENPSHDEDNEGDPLLSTLFQLHLTFRRACRQLRQALIEQVN
jgi:hypothetical protein